MNGFEVEWCWRVVFFERGNNCFSIGKFILLIAVMNETKL
jgi:hypothetical protein